MKCLLALGASSDIGSRLIEKIYQDYDCIIAHYYGWNDNLSRIKEKCGDKLRFIEINLSDMNEVHKMIETINNEGITPTHIVHFAMSKIAINKFNKLSLDKMDLDWKICFDSFVTILQEYLPKMAKNKYGRVVFTLSSVTYNEPPKYEAGYVAIKYALLGLMKSLALEYEDKGICINGVSPDMVNTGFISDIPELLVEQYAFTKENKHILTVDEVVPTFASLLSDECNKNGENILIS